MAGRMAIVERAKALIFGYSIDHKAQSDDELTAQMLGIRLFNAAASGVKLALSGYYQTAFQQAGGSDHDGILSRCASPGRQAEAAIAVAKLR
jgi:hypothetical protein